ncbi:hypothetical protein EDD86DRAFT_197524 [Gorgonomyces haynaldii]|nr:hypothetical protein EDD86DRAFT_197524 [Gorgonomyces haynaldii]
MDQVVVSGEALAFNAKFLKNTRASLAIFLGTVAGILGLENHYGFLFYLLVSGVFSVLVLLKTGLQPTVYYDKWLTAASFGILGNISSFVLFWTLAYGIVHVY